MKIQGARRMIGRAIVLTRLISAKRAKQSATGSQNIYRSISSHVVTSNKVSSGQEMTDQNNNIGYSQSGLTVIEQLGHLFKLKEIPNTSNWIVETKIQSLCNAYVALSKNDKETFLRTLASKYAVDHDVVRKMAFNLACDEKKQLDERQMINGERTLKNVLTPKYYWLFLLTGRLKHGVKFLVDLRTDVLNLLSELKDPDETIVVQQLNITLHDLLLQWFSVGFFDLERVTWQSSCEMLEKVSNYEMIHPIKNWTDLKRRVGPYRRCYVFTHRAMPREPLVVLHTALCGSIPSSVKEVFQTEAQTDGMYGKAESSAPEDTSKIKAAVFYSIASTQRGLQGIELGNYLIKNVAAKVLEEFPLIDQLSSLSPIPNYRIWLLERIKNDVGQTFTKEERQLIGSLLCSTDIHTALKKVLSNSLWINNKDIVEALRVPLLRSCASYLYNEKRRNYALNNVANFHLRNGAVMWRINWLADPSPRGAANSCGIMVNYRYYLHETEANSRNYIERNIIKASEDVIRLAAESETLLQKSRL
ncbi:malonyl-CoA decarboxylase, mitochondrial-like [Neodiprion fabricii]|uniref:malonyl-CoA decarboxylase, mitochondrial-like n=1 Tax=Neodiprion fabricii TaxID=2872261 RepID=UPI001ED944BA|nr:malonyl-CoA decarboxylase, mitochondrial-like [Neodiprion fabricii]